MIEQVGKPHSQRPLYEQVKEQLLAHILDGTYQPLAQLPSEHELSEQFGVSRITVRQALHKLSQRA
jgi:GntR family transcriptional regulator